MTYKAPLRSALGMYIGSGDKIWSNFTAPCYLADKAAPESKTGLGIPIKSHQPQTTSILPFSLSHRAFLFFCLPEIYIPKLDYPATIQHLGSGLSASIDRTTTPTPQTSMPTPQTPTPTSTLDTLGRDGLTAHLWVPDAKGRPSAGAGIRAASKERGRRG